MRNAFIASAAAMGLLAFSHPAAAQTTVSATTDLNVRAGPGPQYQVVGVIGANEGASLMGCIEGSLWCQVSFGGGEGWAYSAYLTAEYSGAPVVIADHRAEIGVPLVTYKGTGDASVVGAVGGAVTGGLIAGPVGAVVGGVAGAAAGAAIDPPDRVRTYVTSNLGHPVYLEGEVVVGASLPQTVQIQTIPDYEYGYVYVNGMPALVEPAERRIVYVIR